MLTRMSTSVTVDTDAVGPDCLKATFDVAVDHLLDRADKNGVAIDWNTIEVALHRVNGADSSLVVRAGVIR